MCRQNKSSAHAMESKQEDESEEDEELTFYSIPDSDNKGQFYEHIVINDKKEIYF